MFSVLRLFPYCLAVLLTILAGSVAAADLSEGYYSFYEGDYNQDGLSDVVLVPKERVLILASSIATPIVYSEKPLVFLKKEDGTFTSLYPADASIIESLTLSPLTYEIYAGDFNGDKKDDLLFQSHENGQQTFIAYGDSFGNGLKAITYLGTQGVSRGATTVEIKDLQNDGVDDVVFTRNNDGVIYAYGGSGLIQETNLIYNAVEPGAVMAPFLAGSFQVDESGAATYSIPIGTPPVASGMVPEISVGYSSNGGNGNMGIGWSMVASSAISRCPANMALDSVIEGVKFDSGDRYCVDGVRLILVSGINGQDGAEYRLQNDNVQRVFAHGVSGSGPLYWEIQSPKGAVSLYGYSADSRRQSDDGHVLNWHITSNTSVYGESIQYRYNSDKSTGIDRLEQVSYGTNLDYSIEFTYRDDRPDQMIGYYAGLLMDSSSLLDSIEMYVPGQAGPIEVYSFNYQSGEYGYTQLISATRCRTSANDCVSTLPFVWSESGFALGDTYTAPTNYVDTSEAWSAVDINRLLQGDFNGDGIDDFYRAAGDCNERDQLFFGKPDSTFKVVTVSGADTCITTGSTDWANIDLGRLKLGDFNGDGKTDIYRINGESNNNVSDVVYFSNGDGSFKGSTVTGGWNYAVAGLGSLAWSQVDVDRMKLGDFDGDGRMDFYFVNGGNGGNPVDYVIFSRSVGTTAKFQSVAASGVNVYVATSPDWGGLDVSRAKIADFNGDGLSDIYYVDGGSNNADTIHFSNGDGSFIAKTVSGFNHVLGGGGSVAVNSMDMARTTVADMNGDGLADFYYILGADSNNSTDYVALSKGDGKFVTKPVSGVNINIAGNSSWGSMDLSRYQFVDFNNDGKVDIYMLLGSSNGNDTDRIAINKGDGVFETVPLSGFNAQVNGVSIGWANGDVARVKFGDFNGDGSVDIYYNGGAGSTSSSRIYPGVFDSAKIVQFAEGIQNYTTVSYETLVQSDHYKIGSNTDDVDGDGNVDVYPISDISGAMQVVTEIRSDNGVGGEQKNELYYEGFKNHALGHGPLGFRKQEVIDTITGIRTITEYSQNYFDHTDGMVTKTTTKYVKDGYEKTLNETVNTNAVTEIPYGSYIVRMPYLSTQTVTSWDFSTDVEMGSVVSNFVYRDDGNLDSTTVVTTDAISSEVFTTVKTMTYEPERYSPHFLAGFVSEIESVSTTPGTPETGVLTSTRKTKFTYNEFGAPLTQIIEPGHAKELITEYQYNADGQVTFTTVKAAGMPDRISEVRYDSAGRQHKQINALGFETTYLYEDATYPWLATKVIDANGLVSETVYDDWGRAVTSISPDGNSATQQLKWCDANCDTDNGEVYFSETSASIGMPSWVFFDKQGREIRKAGYGFSNGAPRLVNQLTEYNSIGKISRHSDPFYEGDVPQWTQNWYDDLGRMLVSYDPAGNSQTTLYVGREVTSSRSNTSGVAQSKTITNNAIGQLVFAKDSLDGIIEYGYDAQGNLIYTKDPKGEIIRAGYDVFGNKEFTEDPNKGKWTYEYDAYGQLVLQSDAVNTKTYMEYDVLGRLVARYDGYQSSNQEVTTWTYDLANLGNTGRKALGMVQRVDMPSYSETFQYDQLGRAISSTTNIDGASYVASTTYNAITGLPDTTTYPNGGLVLKNHYHPQLGNLTKITKNGTSQVYWELEETNAKGQATQFQLGSIIHSTRSFNDQTGFVDSVTSYVDGRAGEIQIMGFNFDGLGNLTEWHDHIQGAHLYVEGYDDLNRMTSIKTVTPIQTRYQNLTYDAVGNIESKFEYDDQTGNLLPESSVGTYTYGVTDAYKSQCGSDAHAGPQAVTYIANGSKSKSYCYDANGNMISGDGRTITYSSFGKPITLEKGNSRVDFYYGPDHARYKRIDKEGSTVTTTHYVGPYEKVVTGSTTTHKYYIGNYAIVTKENNNPLQEHFLLHDHQGSVVAKVDALGNVLDRFAYDPWGRRLATNWQPMTDLQLNAFKDPIVNRGYTGHEHIDSMGLIHMNGRVYDPSIGRFLSADPFVQDATNSQALNRYAYVQNNPMSYTDPSGYFLKKIKRALKKVAKALVKIAVVATFGQMYANIKFHQKMLKEASRFLAKNPKVGMVVAAAACFAAPGVGCAVASFLVTGLTTYGVTGDLTMSLKAGATAAAVAYISSKIDIGVVANGYQNATVRFIVETSMNHVKSSMINGTVNAIKGKSFQDGFNATFKIKNAQDYIESMILNYIGQMAGEAITGWGKGPGTNATEGGSTCEPIDIQTGRKFLRINDLRTGRLAFIRHYNSYSDHPGTMGGKWRHEYEKNLKIDNHNGIIIAVRGDGQTVQFNDAGEPIIKPVGSSKARLQRQGDNWLLVNDDDSVERYNAQGQLLSITYRDGYAQHTVFENNQLKKVVDSDGRYLEFHYDYAGLLVEVTNTGGHAVGYRYNIAHALVRVTQPDDNNDPSDNPKVHYRYEDARFPHALTGLVDEAGKRFGTWEYDARMRAFYEHQEGQTANYLAYQEGNVTTLTDALGRSTTFHFNEDGKPVLVEGHPSANCISSNNQYEYDGNGNLKAKTDWNENRTEYTFNDRGLETARIEAVGTPEAYEVRTEWHDTYRLPVRIEKPGHTTTLEYDDLGQLVQKTIQDTTSWWGDKRVWAYTYNDQRQLVAVDGPQPGDQDTTRFEYDTAGNQTAVINPLQHRTTVLAHNADGLPTLLQDQNGAQTRLDYNARGWLIAKAAQQDNGEWATTRYQYTDIGAYDGTGLVQTVTQPNGASVTYEYNAARQVTALQNNLGERIEYKLDPMGNRIREQIISHTGDLKRTQASVYDELSRLLQSIGADGQRTQFGYDRNGNLTQVTDALERTTHKAYDALNRLVSSIDALQGETTTVYSPMGGVAQVTDARGIITQYEYNGFGDVVALISQDTGTTTFDYDLAGNQTRKEDANGIVTEYQYDVLNRLTHVIYPQASEENIQYHYDVATVNAIGRLARIEDQTGATQRAYDAQGRVVQETRVINGQAYPMGYGYDVAGNLTRMTYPNGAVIRYHRDALGRVEKVTRDTWLGETLLATNIDYLPFGPISGLRYGNGLVEERGYDLDYRLRQHRVSGFYEKTYDYTPVGNISSIMDGLNAANDKAYEYDELSRLTQVVDGTQQAEHFQYDAVGNRTLYQRTANGDVVEASTYEYGQTSNRLQAVQTGAVTRTLGYDAAGNTVRDDRTEQQRVLEYGANNRLKLVAKDGLPVARYQHNAQGQRVIRMVEGEEVHYIYDTQDRLVAEAKGDGTVQRQYVYLGRLLIAVEEAANDQWYFVHNDHLGTPKLVSDVQAAVVWRGEAAAFGATQATGEFGFGFRFPGQTEDGVTGYFYNYFRDYDPSLGRYLQSDPIGLKGGLNTFVYVLGNPIGAIDPFGMDSYLVSRPLNDPRLGKVASHNFIVTGATSLGDPSATVFSYGNNGYGAMGRVYAQGTPGMSATTFNTDRNAWLSLASPGSGVTYRQINAPDGDVMALALSVDEGHPYTVVPELMGGVNSNSAAGAVAHAADGGHALVAGGTVEPGASVAYRVGLNGQCVAP